MVRLAETHERLIQKGARPVTADDFGVEIKSNAQRNGKCLERGVNMNRFNLITAAMFLCAIALVISLPACSSTSGSVGVHVGDEPEYSTPGPPPHAPAYGYRAKHRYRYYPDSGVYFDVQVGVYHYEENGRWRVSASLPAHIHVDLGDYVVIEADSEKPYLDSGKHKTKYPPGQQKKK